MYTLEYLQQKSLKELKEIGGQLNVFPEDDRRYRENWIKVIAGVNPPLLQLLETSPTEDVQAQNLPIIETVEPSPAGEVEQPQEPPIESKFGRIVYPRPAQKAISQVAKTPPGVEAGQAQDIINETWNAWEKEYCAWLKSAEWCVHKGENKRILAFLPVSKTLRLEGMEPGTEYCAIWEVSECSFDFTGRPLPVCSSLYHQESVVPAAETSPGVEQKPNDKNKTHKTDTNRFRAGSPVLHNPRMDAAEFEASSHSIQAGVRERQVRNQLLATPRVNERCWGQTLLNQSVELVKAENSPGVEVDQLPECVECFGDGYFEDESGLIQFCHCSNAEPKLSRQNAQRTIAPAAKFSKPDKKNPILTGIHLSDRFVAHYAPPQAQQLLYKVTDEYNPDADGQLTLFSEVIIEQPEPPDPDDFESLDEFREAIALWDWQHPTSSFDHCSDHLSSSVHCEPSSVQNEPPNPEDFDSMFAVWAAYDAWVADDSDEPPSSEDNDVSSEDKPLELSLDSFCLWAHCPADWYEPAVLLELSKVSELSEVSPTRKTSITSDFFIPTFGSWSDRPDRSDEPPDAGTFAYLPKPKPPNFPPQASWTQVGHKLDTSQPKSAQVRHPETIPKLFSRVVAGSSTQPARSPPGGDA